MKNVKMSEPCKNTQARAEYPRTSSGASNWFFKKNRKKSSQAEFPEKICKSPEKDEKQAFYIQIGFLWPH
jgi:hypothetical protein